MNIHPDGLRGTGPNSSGTDFPFVAPSADVRHVLADAYLSYATDTPRHPLRLVWMFGFDKAFNEAGGDTDWFGDDWFGDDWFPSAWYTPVDTVGDPSIPPSPWFSNDWFPPDWFV